MKIRLRADSGMERTVLIPHLVNLGYKVNLDIVEGMETWLPKKYYLIIEGNGITEEQHEMA